MAYTVKELFYTLQGEGVHSGRPAVFLRFTGCNLWSGREADRNKGTGGCSKWCDTDFVGTDGPGGGKFKSAERLALAVADCWQASTGDRFVVCTGGEPLLQLDAALIEALKAHNFTIAIETNGTLKAPTGIDWVCVSPKEGAEIVLTKGDELKLVYPQPKLMPDQFEHLDFDHFMLQPLDGPKGTYNTQSALDYCLKNPQWRLSIQTHKVLGIP